MMNSRYRATKESLAAMATPGLKLCRESTVGGGNTEWTEAEAQAVNPTTLQVAVKITRSIQAPLVVAGAEVAVGETIWDDPLDWIPCR